jgi:LPXTG-motif cell wall-anchored protein
MLMTGAESIQAFALLAIAIGIAGIAILILFAKKKI